MFLYVEKFVNLISKNNSAMRKFLIMAVMALAVSCVVDKNPAELDPDDLDAQYGVNLIKPGEKAPDFSLTGLDGKTYTLKDFKGKTLVVDFWASWCPDCREETEYLVQLHKDHPEVEFLGISFDTDPEALRTFIAENGMDWLQISEFKKWKETKVSEDYGVKWIPTKYVISPKGKVLLSTVVTKKVEDYLNKKK